MSNARKLRDQRGLRREDVASGARLTIPTVIRVEAGFNVAGTTLVKLADFYGVTLDQLTGRAPLPPTEAQKEAA